MKPPCKVDQNGAIRKTFRLGVFDLQCILLICDFIGPVAIAGAHQSQQPEPQDPRTSDEAADFDAFLDAHPEIDAQLRTNPLLINDQKWLHDHPEVLAYFDHHPQAKNEIAGGPSYFIRREGRRASREARQRSENLRKRRSQTSKNHACDSNVKVMSDLFRGGHDE